MATADDEITTTWLALGAACKLKPEPVLVRRLELGKIRSRGLTKDGTPVEIPSQFWRQGPIIDQDRSSAHTRYLSPAEWWFYQIEVECGDTAVPMEAGEVQSATDSVRWALVTARRLKAEGKLHEGMTKADAARLIEAEMGKAARTGQVRRALKWRSIANQLVSWGLWPVDFIK